MWKKSILATAGITALAVFAISVALPADRVSAQAPTAQSPAVPQWQTDAGGKMEFDVASVKQNKSGPPPYGDKRTANFALGTGDSYAPNGGLFSATNMPLSVFIAFAYKVAPTQNQSLQSQLPKWTNEDRFDIQARAMDTNPTKDQMRLMMQSLLADRFKLAVHTETQQLAIYALVLVKDRKVGPQLHPHAPDSPQCTPFASGATATLANGLPAACGVFLNQLDPGRAHTSVRDVTASMIAGALPLPGMGTLDRPVVDYTGLGGTFDFTLEWTPEASPGANIQPDESGSTFAEALMDQLGLKLKATTGPDVLIIDHVEEPSPN